MNIFKKTTEEEREEKTILDQSIYQERILDYSRKIDNKYIIRDPAVIYGEAENVSCGDSGELFILLDDNNKVIRVSFQGEGCAISQAGMAMLTEYIINKSINELKLITPKDIYQIMGINISPARALCANLCYNTLQVLLKNYDNNI